jgi:hypothetical protein
MSRQPEPAATTRLRPLAFLVAVAGCIASVQSGSKALEFLAAAALTAVAAWIIFT